MKQVRNGLFLLLCLLMLMNIIPTIYGQETHANFDIKETQVVGDITAEGDVYFTQTLTYQIDQVNGIYHEVDLRGVSLGKYRVGIKHPESGTIQYLEESTSHRPRTFHTQIEDELLRFTVYYPARNQEVDFVFEYSLENLITNYQDTAEFNRKVLGTGTNEEMDVKVEIILPGKVDKKEDFRAWLYGDPQGQIQLNNSGDQSRVMVEVPNNQANQFVEIHTIFPNALTPNNSNKVDRIKKEAIIETANKQVEQDLQEFNQRRQGQLLQFLGLLLLGPLLTIYAIYYYTRTKKKLNPSPKSVPEHVFQLPEQITPAIMAAAYLNRGIKADDFSATIVDLARKGYIRLEEESSNQRTGFFNRGDSKTIRIHKTDLAQDQSQLLKHEVYVLQYLFSSEVDQVRLSDIESAIHASSSFAKRQNRLWTKFMNYCQVIGQQLMSQSISYRRKPSFLASLSFLSCIIMGPVIFLIFGVNDIIQDYWPWIVGILLLNILGALFVNFLNRKFPLYSEEEDYKRRMWQGFAKMLDDIGQFEMRNIASLPLWDEYLVYAVSLGVADKVIEAMNKQYGMEELESLSMPRPFYSNAYLLNRALRGSMNSSIAAAHAKPASNIGKFRGTNIGGFGGGASGGSSGGSGGRGGSGGF